MKQEALEKIYTSILNTEPGKLSEACLKAVNEIGLSETADYLGVIFAAIGNIDRRLKRLELGPGTSVAAS